MPFIRGRYHMNPIAGQALEAAREAEAARLAAQEPGAQDTEEGGDGYGQGNAAGSERGPIHRVEIEAAEMVPSHSGRAQRGFVARVHREAPRHGGAAAQQGEGPSGKPAPRAETHVFSDHHDLVSFLHGEFMRDCARK